jgi:hypothetical protein
MELGFRNGQLHEAEGEIIGRSRSRYYRVMKII